MNKKFFKDVLKLIDKNVYYLDEHNNEIDPIEAAKKQIMIKPVDAKLEAKSLMKKIGIDVDDDELVEDLRKILDSLRDENFSGIRLKRQFYNNKFKIKIVDKYRKLNGEITQAEFAKINGLTPVTFISWLSNYDEIKKKVEDELRTKK
jgi:hypothetical protein